MIVYRLGTSAEDYTEALSALELVKFNYLVAPSCETDEQTDVIASWVGAKREEGKKIKAILPNSASDKEYIINYTTESVIDEDGTPIQQSSTALELPVLLPEPHYRFPAPTHHWQSLWTVQDLVKLKWMPQ